MSGYDKDKGWCHFTTTKWRRYYRAVEGQPTSVEERFDSLDIPFKFDRTDGLHAKCTQGEMWSILSGRPSTF